MLLTHFNSLKANVCIFYLMCREKKKVPNMTEPLVAHNKWSIRRNYSVLNNKETHELGKFNFWGSTFWVFVLSVGYFFGFSSVNFPPYSSFLFCILKIYLIYFSVFSSVLTFLVLNLAICALISAPPLESPEELFVHFAVSTDDTTCSLPSDDESKRSWYNKPWLLSACRGDEQLRNSFEDKFCSFERLFLPPSPSRPSPSVCFSSLWSPLPYSWPTVSTFHPFTPPPYTFSLHPSLFSLCCSLCP